MKEHIGNVENLLDFTETEYGDNEFRNEIKNIKFEFVDFDNSNFRNCNITNVIFKNCKLSNCDFTEIRQWNSIYENCIFENCKFYNAYLGNNIKYSFCNFIKSKLNGKYFSFGKNTEFEKCTFEMCEIKSTWILTTKFIECDFSSKFINVRFSGTLEAIVSTTKNNLEFPATFIKCNLNKSTFKALEIMDGAILTNTILPNQENERFNNDRIYYP